MSQDRLKTPRYHMAQVERCTIHDCIFNGSKHCHAETISVGQGRMTRCETYIPSLVHLELVRQDGRVQSCVVTSCALNENGKCRGRRVRIGQVNGQPGCLDYVAQKT